MIEIQPIERVNMTQRIDQLRRRITEIEEKIGISGDFQATLEREIARQASLHAVTPTKAPDEVQPVPSMKQPVNENDIANAAKVAQALREAERVETPAPAPKKSDALVPAQNPLPGEEALPGRINQPQSSTPPKIERVETPDTELEVPSRDDKIFEDNYVGKNAEVIPTEDLVMQTAYEYGVDPKLARAIAIAESDMNQDEISPVGAIGVMQLMPETAEGLGVDPYDEGENIVGGVKYIRQMLDTFDGDVPLAVAAYNAGPAAVKRYGGIPPYAETRNYVGRVMDLFQ